MIVVATLIAVGALRFAEQPLPGLDVSSRTFPAALARTNAVAADLDRDGAPDLVLPGGIWMQKDGLFPRPSMVPLPEHEHFANIYLEHDRLYAYRDGHLTCYSLVVQQWQRDWEASLDLEAAAHSADTALFHDFDGDGRVELVLPLENLLRVFRMVPGAPADGDLAVYPPVRPRLAAAANLWSSAPLRPTSASVARDIHIALDGATLVTREGLRVSEHAFERRIVTYTVGRPENGTLGVTPTSETVYPALSEFMVACHLRKDGPTAFAGARPLPANRLRIGQTVTEVLIAADPAAPVATLRTKSTPAHTALADFDADGDYDLLAQANTLQSRPPREILMTLASARRIRHEFSVYVQETSGNFDARPRKTFAVVLDLERPALEGGPRWDAYRRGELTCSAADFNGDGRADIAAWTTPARIDIWLNHEGVFEKRPDVTLNPGLGRGFIPADVDADGKADMIILPDRETNAAPRVFFAR